MNLPTMTSIAGLSINKAAPAEDQITSMLSLATGETESDKMRLETLNGVEYTVVPVVALVEGVLQGVNAKAPEFAAASEFGKFPKSWDGRPVVMNHPQMNGVFVSAGIPNVLEEVGMGMIFNSRVEDKKLKCEAWLDHNRIESLGKTDDNEMYTTLERIRKGEMVEVSVGAWLETKAEAGVYSGKKYASKWSNVAPDHLAFLSEGTPGACSVADGCGVPRLFQASAVVIGAATSCCDSCAKGEECSANSSEESAEETLAGLERIKDYMDSRLERVTATFEGFDDLSVNQIPENMAFNDIRVIVYQGLVEVLNIPSYDFHVEALTSEGVVYYQYGRAGLWMRTYTVDDGGNIEFSGEDVPVNLLTRILPRQLNEPKVNQKETSMSEAGQGGSPANNEAGAGSAPANQEQVDTPAVNEEVKPPSFEDLLALASPEVRESIEQGTRMLTNRKKALVDELVACERCKFTAEELGKMDISALENMAEMAELPSFQGRQVPADQLGVNTSSQKAPAVASASTNYLGVKPEGENQAAA